MALGALMVPLVGASGAQADVASCVFTGAAGPITPYQGPETGVESVLGDPLDDTDGDLGQGNEGDSLLGPPPGGDPLTDTDNGVSSPLLGPVTPAGADGSYHFDNIGQAAPSLCLAVDDVGETDDPGTTYPDGPDTGLFEAEISSDGEYDNRICGTGLASSRAEHPTTVDVEPARDPVLGTELALGNGEDFTDAIYNIVFAAGSGPLEISFAENENTETGVGAGIVNILPTPGNGNCITEDVEEFQASGAFAITTD